MCAGGSPGRYGSSSVGDEGFMSLSSKTQQSLHILSPKDNVSMSFNVPPPRNDVSPFVPLVLPYQIAACVAYSSRLLSEKTCKF